ncbi:MAG: hypothetical protein IBGAMO2_860014 [Arenicellales bacterium IbO2]|nr:MAG: hypothetical protein IBGAMO2_860014 [Arenicellales bacterium IbO2]
MIAHFAAIRLPARGGGARLQPEKPMNEESINMQIRKFLKKVGITSQREIEAALRKAEADGSARAGGEIPLDMTLRIQSLGVSLVIEDTIRFE